MYKTLNDVPAELRVRKGVTLNVEQANAWARIYDVLKDTKSLDNPAGAAWLAWERVYQVNGAEWEKRTTALGEGVSLEFAVGAVSLVESAADGLPREAIVDIIKAGPTKTKGRFYDPEALMGLAESGWLKGLKQYDNHIENAEQRPMQDIFKPRSLTEFWSYVKEAWWNPGTQTIQARIKLCDQAIKLKLKDAWEAVGISLTALGETYIGKDGLEHVKKIVQVVSADWVPEANAGGRVLQLVEAVAMEPMQANPEGREVNKNMMPEWKDLTMEMLKTNRPDVVDQILYEERRQQEAAKELIKKAEETANAEKGKAEKATQEADAAKKEATAAKTEAAEYKRQLDEKTKALAEFEAKSTAAETKLKVVALAEEKTQGFTPLAKSAVLKELEGKTFADDKALAEAVDAAVTSTKAKMAQGSDGGNGGGDNKPAKQLAESSKKFADQLGISEEEQKRLAEIED